MLNVLVVGAGIAGLSTAISLRRAGHVVQVFERSGFRGEFGAAMNLTANASRPLLAWGIDPKESKYDVSRGVRLFNGKTLDETRLPIPMGERATAKYGAPTFFMHRVDFHESLRRLATQAEGHGTPATLHVNSEVVKFDTESATITLANGEVITGGLIVAADGIHSTAVEEILGHPNQPRPLPGNLANHHTQNSCFRFIIPAKVLQSDPTTKWWVDECNAQLRVYTGPVQFLAYPCRQGELFNFVCMYHNKDLGISDVDGSSVPADMDAFHDYVSWFHPKLQEILKKATQVRSWPLHYRAPIPTWRKGKLCLAGDAAHPMLPHYGQGGTMGIEDAVALGIALVGAEPEQVEERLGLWEEIRKPRATVFQILSVTGQENVALVTEEASKTMDNVPKIPPQIPDFVQGYDIVKETVKFLKDRIPDFELPTTFFEKK